MKDNKQIIKIVACILLVVIVFFSYSVTYTYDSFHYLNYVDILFRRVPFYTWDIVRGPSFPLTLFIFNIFLGENQNAHLILQFLCFSMLILIVNKLLENIFNNSKSEKIVKKLFIIFIVFNPIIFGYFHVMLTEFIAITLTMVSIYLSHKWISLKNKKMKLLYTGFFSILLVYLWFLKQPFAVSVIAPLFTASIISIFRDKSIKNIIYRVGTIICSIIFMLIAVISWNAFLISHSVDMNTGRDSGSMMANTILSLSSYKILDSGNQDLKLYMLNEKEEKNIIDNKYAILLTINDNKIIDKDIISKKNGKMKTIDVILTSVENIFQHPTIILKDYASNYCAISSLCVIETVNGVDYTVGEQKELFQLYENDAIGYRIFKNEIPDNTFWVPEKFQVNSTKYHVYKNVGIINKIFVLFIPITNIVYKYLTLGSIMIFIILAIILIVLKKYYNDKDIYLYADIPIICINFSILYLLASAYVGAIIDRYSVEAFVPLLIVSIYIVYLLAKIIKMSHISHNNKKIKRKKK